MINKLKVEFEFFDDQSGNVRIANNTKIKFRWLEDLRYILGIDENENAFLPALYECLLKNQKTEYDELSFSMDTNGSGSIKIIRDDIWDDEWFENSHNDTALLEDSPKEKTLFEFGSPLSLATYLNQFNAH